MSKETKRASNSSSPNDHPGSSTTTMPAAQLQDRAPASPEQGLKVFSEADGSSALRGKEDASPSGRNASSATGIAEFQGRVESHAQASSSTPSTGVDGAHLSRFAAAYPTKAPPPMPRPPGTRPMQSDTMLPVSEQGQRLLGE